MDGTQQLESTRCMPLRVGPSPEVLAAIRAEMHARKLTLRDLMLENVTAQLVMEPIRQTGLNSGIFYFMETLPARAAALSPAQAVRGRPTTGTLRLLVLLVDFSDNQGSRSQQDFKDMLFSRAAYPTGSMRDYYKENSYSQLDIDGDVIGWIRLPQTYSYYVNGSNGMGAYPQNAQETVEDALNLAVQQGVDFRQFDSDGDNYIDGLFVIHAGGGAEAQPDPAKRTAMIWSHQWNIRQPFVSNGKTAYAYLTVPEDGRVGVFCHEFGHMLGLPDLYDTSYKSEGVGAWCVMGGGSWNDGGLTPAHFCAWSKARLGWIQPQIVNGAQSLSLNAIEQDRQAIYRLWTNGQTGDEYFLLENRELTGFDAKLPGAGLLIWHIDDARQDNTNPKDYWVGLEEADGNLDLENNNNRGDDGDPYPGRSNSQLFDDTSNPKSIDHGGNSTGVSVSNIQLQNGVITCDARV